MIDLSRLKGRRCVVLGGRGFIGQHLVKRLASHGAVVVTFGRGGTGTPSQDWMQIQHVTGSMVDIDLVASVLRAEDYVFHLVDSGFPGARPDDAIAALESVTIPTVKLLAACTKAGVKKMIFVSSGGAVYGAASQIHTEDSPTNPISAYGVGKLATEKSIHLAHHLSGLEYAILRVSNPYGPGQSAGRGQGLVSAVMKKFIDSAEIEVWGDGQVVRDFVYVGDVAMALAKAAVYEGTHAVMNVGSGLGRRVVDVINDIKALVPNSRSVLVYKAGRPADVTISILDVARARDELGWRADTLWLDGLRATFNWMQADGAQEGVHAGL